MKKLFLLTVLCLFVGGCEGLRFAPTEDQKQNAWLHNRTAIIAAETARAEEASDKLKALTELSELQSRAFVSYCGLPGEFPKAERAEDILDGSNQQLAAAALSQSARRPDGWQLADSAMELAIGICALFGGAYGLRAVQFLRTAKSKSEALREIVTGNELFKKQNADAAEAFKQAHGGQSPQTRQIVAQMK